MRGRREENLGSDGDAISQLGATIRAWRHYRGFTVKELAIQAGFGENGTGYISKIEHGYIKRLNDSRINSIAQALNVKSADLLTYCYPPGTVPDSIFAAGSPEQSTGGQKELGSFDRKQIFELINKSLNQLERRLRISLGDMLQETFKRMLFEDRLWRSTNQTASSSKEPTRSQDLTNLQKNPLIGIPCYAGTRAETMSPLYGINRVYVSVIENAGGIPVLIPHPGNIRMLHPLCAVLKGLLLPGGGDIDPSSYGDEPHPALHRTDPQEDYLDLKLIDYFLEMDLPILGISRGMQLLNVARGGTLYQDIQAQRPESMKHDNEYTTDKDRSRLHQISIEPDTHLARLMGTDPLTVNSFHHQAIKTLGGHLVASAWAPDGIIEALELENYHFVVGVQFQAPELVLQGDQRVLRLFEGFIEEATSVRRELW